MEQKWHYGKIESFTGTVLHIQDDRIYLLSQGNKVWKDKSNQKDVVIMYTTRIEKLKDAKPNFDIFKADPYYAPVNEIEHEKWWQKLDHDRAIKFQKRLLKKYPDFDVKKSKLLWLQFDFYWAYNNSIVKKADINIITKNGSSMPLPNYENKHIYPNHDYFTACMTEKEIMEYDCEKGIILCVDDMEVLENIRVISCLWAVELEETEEKFLTIVYPKFLPETDYVYNLSCSCTDMQTYEKSLHSHSVFSGQMEKEYDKAYLYISNADGEVIDAIMRPDDIPESLVFDLALCLNKNNLKTVIESLCDPNMKVTEVFVKNTEIIPKGYISSF